MSTFDPAVLDRLLANIRTVIVGKDDVVELAVAAMVARGHVLIEDRPGLGKTMLARAIAQSIGASFHRIQCTPDLLPSDVTGVSIYRPGREEFEFGEAGLPRFDSAARSHQSHEKRTLPGDLEIGDRRREPSGTTGYM